MRIRMWTSRPVLPLTTATAPSSGVAATCRPALPPERRPLVPSHLSRLDDPIPSEFRRTESSSPDLRSQRVGGDPKLRGGFPEGQKSHSGCLVWFRVHRSYSYASRYVP